MADCGDSGAALLRDWSASDGAWYVSQLHDPEILHFTTERPETTADDFRAALHELNKHDNLAGFAIIDRATGELAGNLAAGLENGTACISYWIAPGHRRRGMATAALNLMCEWVTANWPTCALAMEIYEDNEASQRVAAKAGFLHQPERDRLDNRDQRVWRWYSR